MIEQFFTIVFEFNLKQYKHEITDQKNQRLDFVDL